MTAAPPAEPVLRVCGAGRSFAAAGEAPVLRGLDLEVAAGEIVAVVGRSGSGKTTLLTAVIGMDALDHGSISLLGRPLSSEGPAWQDLAVLPQSLGLLEELTVAENVELPLRLGAVADPAPAVEGALERLGLGHLAHRHPSEVSLGEQQRTALARALVVSPRLLVADEPISHQNHDWAREMVAAIDEHAERGMACLLATHSAVAVERAHRVLELHDGRLRPRASRTGTPTP